MKTLRILTLIILLSCSCAVYSQPDISSAGLNPQNIPELKLTKVNYDTWLPTRINGLPGRHYSFWKLTKFGFMFYADGKFYYEDGFFRNLWFMNGVSGNYYLNAILNGYLDFRMTPYYNNTYYNYCMYISPYSGYMPYQKIVNINSYIPVLFSFRPLKFRPVNNVPANPDVNTFRPPMPLNLTGNNCRVDNDIEIRKVQKFNYEKTGYEEIYINSGIPDIRNEFYRKNNNQVNNYGTNKSGNSNQSNSNRNNNGNKTVSPGNTNTQKPAGKSE